MKNDIVVLRAGEIQKILENREEDIIGIIKKAYLAHDAGRSSLPHSVFLRFPDNDKDRIIGLPAYLGGEYAVAGMKWISSFPNNIEKNIERASAVMLLNEMSTGRVQAVIEGSIISAKRTAASAALAARYLHQNPAEQSVGLVGCGRINREILAFLLAVFPGIKTVYVYDHSAKRSQEFAQYNADAGVAFVSCASVQEIFDRTKLVSFATTAGVPFVDKIDSLSEDHTILGISLRDLAPAVIRSAHNVVDDFDHVCREKTSIHLTFAQTHSKDFVAGSIAQVVDGKVAPRAKGKPTIFSPFGLGILDLAVAQYLYLQAKKRGMGITIEDFLPEPFQKG